MWYDIIQNMPACTPLPAEDLGKGQNLSVAVPHWHRRRFTAAQATQERGRCFLLVCCFSALASLCQVLPRATPAHSLQVSSLHFMCLTTLSRNLLVRFLLLARREGETDSLYTVDLHKRQVKLKNSEAFSQANFKLPSPALFLIQKCPYLVLCARVPVEELEEAQRVSVPHQNEVPCSVCQVSGRREALRTLGTRAGHTSQRHTPELALHTNPLTWRDKKRQCYIFQKSKGFTS